VVLVVDEVGKDEDFAVDDVRKDEDFAADDVRKKEDFALDDVGKDENFVENASKIIKTIAIIYLTMLNILRLSEFRLFLNSPSSSSLPPPLVDPTPSSEEIISSFVW
jgi:hypothetical protein